jgi:hypothetical protein
MLKTDNENARKTFRKIRAEAPIAHEYISFIHRNFPDEELNQYTLAEWRAVASHVGIDAQSRRDILSELKGIVPEYQNVLRDLFAE